MLLDAPGRPTAAVEWGDIYIYIYLLFLLLLGLLSATPPALKFGSKKKKPHTHTNTIQKNDHPLITVPLALADARQCHDPLALPAAALADEARFGAAVIDDTAARSGRGGLAADQRGDPPPLRRIAVPPRHGLGLEPPPPVVDRAKEAEERFVHHNGWAEVGWTKSQFDGFQFNSNQWVSC
jgi:hypothetical protein